MDHKQPDRRITSAADLGQIVRSRRKGAGLTQARTAALAGVGTRFLSDLERGKSTAELGKTLAVLQIIGLDLLIQLREERTP